LSIRPRSFIESPQRNMPTSSRSSSPLATGHLGYGKHAYLTMCAQRADRRRAGIHIPSRQRHWVDHRNGRTGLDVIIIYTLPACLYSALDIGSRRVGLAATQSTTAKYSRSFGMVGCPSQGFVAHVLFRLRSRSLSTSLNIAPASSSDDRCRDYASWFGPLL
jgi:hypothetical protein